VINRLARARPARAALALALAAAAVLFGPRLGRPPSASDRDLYGAPLYSDGGELLLHRLPPSPGTDPSYHMPSASVLSALLAHHAAPAALSAWRAWSTGSIPLLALALGALVGGWPCGLFAAALCVARNLAPAGVEYVEGAYAAFFLLAVAALAWRARRPGPAADAAAGLATGASLLFRSPLAFLLPMLFLFEWARSRRARPAAALARPLGWAALALAPWWLMNARVHGAFVPFEHGEAVSNVVTGALGLVPPIEGSWRALAPGLTGSGLGAALAWAAGEILRHPLRYAAACAARAAFALRLHPFLAAFAVFGAWRERRRPEVSAAAGAAAYFLGVHCLMSVRAPFFYPLWPLAAVLAAAPLAPLADERDRRPSLAAAAAVFAVAGAGAAALTAFALERVAAYAVLAPQDAAVARRDFPDDPWLAARALRGRERAPSTAEAAEFAAAVAAHPEDPQLAVDLSWARARSGDWNAGADAATDSFEPRLRVEAALVRAESNRRLGRRSAAAAAFAEAGDLLTESSSGVLNAGTAPELAALRRLRTADAPAPYAAELLRDMLGPAGRLDLLAAAASLDAAHRAQWLAAAEAATEVDADSSTCVGDYRRWEAALSARTSPAAAKFYADKGVCDWLTGDRRAAALDLEKSRRLDPDRPDTLKSLEAIRRSAER